MKKNSVSLMIDFLKRKFPGVKPEVNNVSLSFRGVSFRYPGTEKKVLNRVSFTIDSQRKTALVGLDGVGRSTLILLILRLFRPTEGQILINGVDINTISYEQYVEQFGEVLQDLCLIAYGIRENGMGNITENEKLFNEVHASIYKELRGNESRATIWGPKKLAMAKELYRNGSIVILDQPADAYGAVTEYDFFRCLEAHSKGKTMLFVTPQLSSTVFCDRILLLKNGKVVEKGTHSRLMARGGKYKELFMQQARYYEQGVGGRLSEAV